MDGQSAAAVIADDYGGDEEEARGLAVAAVAALLAAVPPDRDGTRRVVIEERAGEGAVLLELWPVVIDRAVGNERPGVALVTLHKLIPLVPLPAPVPTSDTTPRPAQRMPVH